MQKAKKAIILARVSSKDQEEGYSIDAQISRLKQYCTHKDLEVIKIYALSESSTRGDRKKFMEMIEFAKSQNNAVAIIADKVDRLQRGSKETHMLDELIRIGKIEIHFNTEGYVIHKDSTSHERMMWGMGVVIAQSYTDCLSDNVKRSINQKLKNGEWISQAPIGYLNIRDSNGRAHIVLDEERAPLIRKLFEEYATGNYSLEKLRKETIKWGFTNSRGKQKYLSKSHIHSILTNTFYYGVMRYKNNEESYPHIYEPIITKNVFEQCENVRFGWKKKPNNWGTKDHLFKKMIRCAATGKQVTPSVQKRKYKNGETAQWCYLETWNPENTSKKIWVREEEVLDQINDELKQFYIEPEVFKQVESCIHEAEINEINTSFYCLLKDKREKIKHKIDRLSSIFLEEKISRDEYRTTRRNLLCEKQKVDKEIKKHMENALKHSNELIALGHTSVEAQRLFATESKENKRKLLNLLFAQIKLRGSKLELEYSPSFDRFRKILNNLKMVG